MYDSEKARLQALHDELARQVDELEELGGMVVQTLAGYALSAQGLENDGSLSGHRQQVEDLQKARDRAYADLVDCRDG